MHNGTDGLENPLHPDGVADGRVGFGAFALDEIDANERSQPPFAQELPKPGRRGREGQNLSPNRENRFSVAGV